jgi:fatty-acyl-CoA synthase
MQDGFPLTLTHVLRRMRTVHARSSVVTQVAADGTRIRASFADVAERADRLAAGLDALGVRPGDRVGSFAWNTQQYLEAYYAVPCMGAVLHTMNLRLAPEEVAFTVNHSKARVLLVDASLAEPMSQVRPLLRTVEHVIIIGERTQAASLEGLDYETLLANQTGGYAWPELDERSAAALCYTSGTTGDPKGVLYSHRSLVLHALVESGHDTFRMQGSDVALLVVPMFHAMGWNLPYICGLIGADVVMPSSYLQSSHLARLIEEERVTYSSGVPTIWMDLLRYAAEHGCDLTALRLAVCGGTQVPSTLMQQYEERHGIALTQGWGMTETLPGAAMAHDPDDSPDDEHRWAHRAFAGRLSPLYEIRVSDDDGNVQPWDGKSTGEIEIRGPIVAGEYFENPEGTAEKIDDGWLRTGDVGSMTHDGWLRITDRAKDVIKSGGEWISSVDLESALMAHPAVAEAAVIARPDERWSERPLACVVVEYEVTPDELRAFLADRVARWWLPDDFAYMTEIPRTSVGKFDKRVLRGQLKAGALDVRAIRGHSS